VSPGAWTGSVPILAQYVKQQDTVKYGQCWTAAGVLTTGNNNILGYFMYLQFPLHLKQQL
jgi:hypothetical protein